MIMIIILLLLLLNITNINDNNSNSKDTDNDDGDGDVVILMMTIFRTIKKGIVITVGIMYTYYKRERQYCGNFPCLSLDLFLPFFLKIHNDAYDEYIDHENKGNAGREKIRAIWVDRKEIIW